MAAGLPIVASDFPEIREVIVISKSGFLVNPESPKEIAGAIKKILSNKKVYEEMKVRGQEAIKKWFNWENEEKKLIKLYKELANA